VLVDDSGWKKTEGKETGTQQSIGVGRVLNESFDASDWSTKNSEAGGLMSLEGGGRSLEVDGSILVGVNGIDGD
jgi:hypothetical protein